MTTLVTLLRKDHMGQGQKDQLNYNPDKEMFVARPRKVTLVAVRSG